MCRTRTASALGAVTVWHRPEGARCPGRGARGGCGVCRAALLGGAPRAGTGPGGGTGRRGARPRLTSTVAAVGVIVRHCGGERPAGQCGAPAGRRCHGQGPAPRNSADATGVAGGRRLAGRGRRAARGEHPWAQPGAAADRRGTDRGRRGWCGRWRGRARGWRRFRRGGRRVGEWAAECRGWSGRSGQSQHGDRAAARLPPGSGPCPGPSHRRIPYPARWVHLGGPAPSGDRYR